MNIIVNVMLSTYNGEKYLKEQLDSVLNQEKVIVRLYIRDDGSSDDTIKILQEYQSRFPNIYLFEEQNLGCINSFLRLIYLTNSDSEHGDYFAFCDQDDIWDKDKLIEGIQMLKEYDDIPALYCSNLKVVDHHLNFIRYMNSTNAKPDKNTCLLTNIATGCTCIMNRKLVNLHTKRTNLEFIIMHDWWFYCLASFYGKVIYDKRAFINYRQHQKNVFGARTTSHLKRFLNLLKSFIHSTTEHYRERQAKVFFKANSSFLPISENKIIENIAMYRASLWNRIKLALNFITYKNIDYRTRIRILLGLI